MAANLPEPIAEGDLAKTPFAHVLLYAEKHALTGTLVVWRPEPGEEKPKQDRLLLSRGQIVGARLIDRAPRLDRGLLPLFARTSGPYAFYQDVDLVGSGDAVRTGRVELLPLIAASLRGSSRDDVVTRVLAGLGGAKLRMPNGIDLESYGFLPEERQLIDALRAEPMTAAKIADISPLAPRMAERLVYLLAITKAVAPWEGEVEAPKVEEPKRPSFDAARARAERHAREAADAVPPPVPSGLAAEHEALWKEVVARCATIERENYFDMLGVARDAPAQAIQKAYFHLVKKWHPDRVPNDLAALRPFVERIFRYLTRAQEILSDEEQRGQYLGSVQDGGGTPESERQLGRIVHAALEYRKVEVLIRRRELTEALALIDEILAVADDEADYHATRAWIVFSKDQNDASVRPGVLASLERALAIAPNHDKAHYYKGMVLDRAGRAREADECFRKAAELNPKNIEAVRMVRIADMRKRDEPAPKKSDEKSGKTDSLLNKFFGKK